ncbi:MAG TPA: DUF3887 domain-containing protein [Candidatus Angelobacter sp.]|nr:DUF3887 domain-containing protein [Candidatus Angelobacter sp.]
MKTPVSIESQSTLRLALCSRKTCPLHAFLPVFAVFVAVFFFTGAVWGQETNRYTKVANQIVDLINAGDYAGIQTNFNPQMAAALPLDKSRAFFAGLTRQFGKIEKLGEPQSVGGALVYPAKFEKGTLDMQLVLEDQGELIAGLMFKPRAAAKPRQESQTDRYLKVANQLKDLINGGDYAGMQARFNKELDAALPVDKSSEFFKGLAQQVGKVQKFGEPQFVVEGMVLPTEFEKGTLDMQLALDGSGQIAGLAFTPHAEK